MRVQGGFLPIQIITVRYACRGISTCSHPDQISLDCCRVEDVALSVAVEVGVTADISDGRAHFIVLGVLRHHCRAALYHGGVDLQ